VRTCVIGAGFAGLAAADALRRGGAEVVVLEARDRVGGRVHSERLANGGVVERGGEFVTAGYEATERLCAQHGIALDGMGIFYPERTLVPGPAPDRAAVLAGARALADAAAAEPPGTPAPDLLERVVADPDVRDLLASRAQTSTAYAFDDLDARHLLGIQKLVDDAETLRIRGGNQALATALAAGLGGAVHLGEPATGVAHDASGVRVRTARGTVEADVCVVAVPVALYGELPLDPPLPAATREALAAIPVSTAAKLHVPLTEAVAPAAYTSRAHRFWAWTSPCDEIGGRVVGSWAGSAPVVAGLRPDAGPETWLARLRELWPGLPLQEAGASLTIWQDDPWSRGAYSVLAAPSAGADPFPSAGAFGRIVLAGEHTAGSWSATMEGALRSGERAAADVLALGLERRLR
jgi:monoamine oxidase